MPGAGKIGPCLLCWIFSIGHSKWFRYPVRSLDVHITASMPLDPQKMQANLTLFAQDIRVELPTVSLIFSECKTVNN